FLTFKFMGKLSGLVERAYVDSRFWGWRQPDQKARDEIEQIGKLVTDHLDQLYTQSPETYVRHAANILGRFRAFEVWRVERQLEHNPVFAHLANQHHEAWHRSPEGIRELMESPNIYVVLLGLEILEKGGPDAARRIVENLLHFRALLLGRTRLNTKKQALACLEQAMQQGPEFAGQIAPMLEEAFDFRGKRAISKQIMVSYVRAQAASGLMSSANLPEATITQ